MFSTKLDQSLMMCAWLVVAASTADAQTVETVGSRALGMGGAFVAVATDSSASWWNPAGLAAGPFLDMAIGHATTETVGEVPANRAKSTWFTLGTPPFGFSYYRLRLTDVRLSTPTVTESGSREDRRAGVPVQSVAASQLGITLVHTLIPGIHAGATVKYVRATVRGSLEDGERASGDLLDSGDELEDGDADGAFDADLGLIAVTGPVRLGLLVRNAREAEFENAAGLARMERQIRIGAAYAAADGGGPPLTVAIDADLRTTHTSSGERRNVAVGGEHWVAHERVGLRAGARINTVGERDRAATGGVSVAVRSGLFLDAHVVRGGAEDDRGWGVAARVSF